MIKTPCKAIIIANDRPTSDKPWFRNDEHVIGEIVTVQYCYDLWHNKFPRYVIDFQPQAQVNGHTNRACLEHHLMVLDDTITLSEYIQKRLG